MAGMAGAISGYLVTQTLGVAWTGSEATSWQIAEQAKPDKPDDLISLFGYGGEPSDLHTDLDYPRLQVYVRSSDYETGLAKVTAIYEALHGLSEETLDSTRYLLLQALAAPESLGRDAERRYEFVCNFRTIKER